MKKIKDVREKIQDKEVKKIFDKYEAYMDELDIYERYTEENPSGRIYKYKLARLYREKEIEFGSKKALEERFKKFSSNVEKVKQENEGIDLHDIRTQKNRETISELINQTQKGREVKIADLDPIAIIEDFSLCVAIGSVEEKKMSVQEALEKFQITEEEFVAAQNSYKEYEQSGMMENYNNRMKEKGKPKPIIHYTAGCLELTPAQARNDLAMIGVLKGEEFVKRKTVIEKYCDVEVSQAVIDTIMMNPNLTLEQKEERIQQEREKLRRPIEKLVKETNLRSQNEYKIKETNNVIDMTHEEDDDDERGIG